MTPGNLTDLVRAPQAAPRGCPCSADSAAADGPTSDTVVHRAAARADSGWQRSCVRRVHSSQRKGQAPSSSRRPPAERLPAVQAGHAPLSAYRPPTLGHTAPSGAARPPSSACCPPTHLHVAPKCPVPPRRGRDAQLTDFGSLGAGAENCSWTRLEKSHCGRLKLSAT